MSNSKFIIFGAFIGIAILLLSGCQSNIGQEDSQHKEEWIALFNGTDLSGWTPKFSKMKAGENYRNTFRIKDSLLQVSYENYDTFNNEFGHLVHEKEFSYYRIKSDYRFVGEQVNGGAAWAFRNNGLMLHSQSAASMTLEQNFPMSIELQLLGGNGKDERTTGNLCTPGCHVHMDDTLVTKHCISSNSKTYHGDKWVTAEALVLGDSIIHQIINGDTVLSYTRPIIGGDLGGLDTLQFKSATTLDKGYIAIQAESHGIDFRNIDVLDLCGCMDKKASNYKSYFVKADNSKCVYNQKKQ